MTFDIPPYLVVTAPSRALPLNLRMESSELATRLGHPHYIANVFLSLPLPLLLLVAPVDLKTKSTLLAGPGLLVLLVIMREGGREAETNVEMVTWNMRVFNLFGLLFTRKWLGLKWHHVLGYVLVWLAVSFIWPQPAYRAKANMKHLNAEEFDEQVLIIPPISRFTSSSEGEKIVEIPEDAVKSYDTRRKQSKVWNVVLFHTEWSRKSRELEITLSRMSCRLSSPTLSFCLITPESAPQPFYDLNLSTETTSLDLPLIALYYKGTKAAQLPRGAKDIQLERKSKRAELRKKGISTKKVKKPRNDDESESGSETDESEDERQVEQEAARERYKWDRTAVSLYDRQILPSSS